VVDLAAPGALARVLSRHGIRAEKDLGQHFLTDFAVVQSILEASEPAGSFLEIGPGPGILTQGLSRRAPTLALELDPRMTAVLAETAPNAEVRQADALQVDLAGLLHDLPRPRVLVSNLPYYITGPLLERIGAARAHLERAVLMMQREVAERIAAPAGHSDRGALSVFVQRSFALDFVRAVPPEAFLPPPRVHSSVLRFTPRPFDPSRDGAPFDRLVRIGFSNRRKTLANNLGVGYRASRETVNSWLGAAGIAEKARAQELTEDQWTQLLTAIQATN
jgi:16S rRNA (adenine1518-N6/adenine1519-N6)-dimethyltransferase